MADTLGVGKATSNCTPACTHPHDGSAEGRFMIDDRDAERCQERCQEPFPDLVVGKVWLERRRPASRQVARRASESSARPRSK